MRVNIQDDGFVNDVLRFSSNLICDDINCFSHFLETVELFAGDFIKDCPRFGIIMQVIQSKF